MTDEPENLTLKLLREMRAEMREGFEKAFGELAEVRGELAEMHGRTNLIPELCIAVAAISVDLKATKALLGEIHEVQKNQGARLNAMDGRLAIIEKHTELVKA